MVRNRRGCRVGEHEWTVFWPEVHRQCREVSTGDKEVQAVMTRASYPSILLQSSNNSFALRHSSSQISFTSPLKDLEFCLRNRWTLVLSIFQLKQEVSPVAPHQPPQAETGAASQVLARGKYLFLTRRLTKGEASKFATLGYRFATVGQIAEPPARNMRADSHSIVSRLERMKLSASADHLPPPGVHLACFMVRPSQCCK